jgi:hypothetical protein
MHAHSVLLSMPGSVTAFHMSLCSHSSVLPADALWPDYKETHGATMSVTTTMLEGAPLLLLW